MAENKDPLAIQDDVNDKNAEKVQDEIIDRVAEAKDEGREESDRLFAERMVHGFAPPLDPTDPRPREVKEREVQEAMGIKPGMTSVVGPDKDKAQSKQGSTDVEAKSSADVARELERLRSGPGQVQGEVREVTVNGTRYLIPTDRSVKVPANVAKVLEESDRLVHTTQMLGGTDGVPTIDLTKE